MIFGKYELTISLTTGAYPIAAVRPGANNVVMPPMSDEQRAEYQANARDVTHYVEFYEEDGQMKACHQTELSKQLADDLVITKNTVSWKAYSGSEGVDLWQYCLGYTDVSDDVGGAAFGLEPFFRGYMTIYGKKIG